MRPIICRNCGKVSVSEDKDNLCRRCKEKEEINKVYNNV
jgi:DNA-directed RNA polymerase subunit N (RpoN/RPB10)